MNTVEAGVEFMTCFDRQKSLDKGMIYMSRSLKAAGTRLIASLALLIAVSMGVIWFSPLNSSRAHSPANGAIGKSSLPYNAYANGPYKVQGNTIVGVDGKPYLFHGIGRDGLEYSCTGDGFFDAQHLAYMGPGTSSASGTYWYSNTVRLPLTEGYWLNGKPSQSCTAAQYQALVKTTVDTLTSMKLNVIIDLQWSDAGGQATGGGAGWQMPDNDSVTFWQQVAKIYAGYSNVLFELFNEPHPAQWSCWAASCTITNDTSWVSDCSCKETFTYKSPGMQGLVNAIRRAGANNLVLVAGMNWGYDLSQITTYRISGTNVVYDTHPYPYPQKQPANWDTYFGKISATYPVMSAENGEYDCGTSYMSPLLSYFDAHSIGWMAWAWVSVGSPCGYPQLITDYQGTPAASMGVLIYQQLLSYAGIKSPPTPTPSPTPSPTTSPVNSTWYFAEGKVGSGFTEYLTIENPDSVNSCSVNIQYLLVSGNTSKSITVPAGSRYTVSVNNDLQTPANSSSSKEVSTVVTVPSGTSCKGVVAERPIYFTNFFGISSGTDVVGATQTGKNFYFADVPTVSGYYSFITILNPPGGNAATVTATYYANGQQVGNPQTTTVQPGTRGTIVPTRLNKHVAALVTSSAPVVIERPAYFSNISEGNAGTVSGAASVVGAQNPTTDWLFAEGYTGTNVQENLVLANFSTTDSIASLVLKYDNGHIQTIPVTVPHQGQATINVNTYNSHPLSGACDTNPCQPSPNVSAEITASVNIVVEREMFFHYNHNANGRSLGATGGTDVTGQPGPATATAYSFAEGFVDTGYDEWLTLQNPMGTTENITVTLVNEEGHTYSQVYPVNGNSRFTVDITGMVIQHLIQSGDSYPGYEVSMTVSSANGPFVAERPMYWNASGTQGGSDVIGYSGS